LRRYVKRKSSRSRRFDTDQIGKIIRVNEVPLARVNHDTGHDATSVATLVQRPGNLRKIISEEIAKAYKVIGDLTSQGKLKAHLSEFLGLLKTLLLIRHGFTLR
jgi:hypothetical protein